MIQLPMHHSTHRQRISEFLPSGCGFGVTKPRQRREKMAAGVRSLGRTHASIIRQRADKTPKNKKQNARNKVAPTKEGKTA
jgi:hypothetical protein